MIFEAKAFMIMNLGPHASHSFIILIIENKSLNFLLFYYSVW
jgi:hypothetical protein